MGKEIFRGFKFGMILQIAIGPICIFIFQTACKYGFFMGEMWLLDAVLVEIIVGIVLIYFAIKLLIKKDKEENGELK